jgi:nitrogen fixation NifU-like protein
MNNKDEKETLYTEELLDHFKFPKNKKKIDAPDFSSGSLNTFCGDYVYISGKIKNNKIINIYFDGKGCVISQATASILTQLALGKSTKEILVLTKEDILACIKINLGPNRLKCALLSLYVLQDGIKNYLNSKKLKE